MGGTIRDYRVQIGKEEAKRQDVEQMTREKSDSYKPSIVPKWLSPKKKLTAARFFSFQTRRQLNIKLERKLHM